MDSVDNTDKAKKTISIVVASNEDTTITYSNDTVSTSTGSAYITNCNDIPIEIVLIEANGDIDGNAFNGDGDMLLIPENNVFTIDGLKPNCKYTVGIRADADEGTNLTIDFADK